ncbi:hypothetical protein CTAYLR_005113 [Chrysophaeum taylorii]|uniref:FAD-binding domain-containing protein n=1 Tax=Chrysophaeum taylorii TaxID=2483200 RepID=A0AAD7UEP9_9STRA|nr:hypothetical protein CTAYLR_005113 [Chrysophaeum taylorii]
MGVLLVPAVVTAFLSPPPSRSWARWRAPPRAGATVPNEVTAENPLRVVIAGAGVGGLALANALRSCPHVEVTVFEKTSEFKRFGGPIQLASNAMQIFKAIDGQVYAEIEKKFTWTGNLTNGIKDGLRDEWYAKFDLKSPADARGMPYTGVIERPELQDILLRHLGQGVVLNGQAVAGYDQEASEVLVELTDGSRVGADVLVGADGIWSEVRATMRSEPSRGEGSGVAYSGYTVFAGELDYESPTRGIQGYSVYIGPNQYFVITDIGNGRYQWYAFLARPPNSAEVEEKPDGNVGYLRAIFEGWSPDIHDILSATGEHEIEQRDLYDRPPSALRSWSDGAVALLGDSIHAMMPNLGQGGCQAIEDAFVIAQELNATTARTRVPVALKRYRDRRLVRSATVQGLSRFASDIIIRGFDTPFKLVVEDGKKLRFENANYAGIVTRLMQGILPLFFMAQFNFLYDGWRNEVAFDLKAGLIIASFGALLLLLAAGAVGDLAILLPFGLESLGATELFASLSETISSVLPSIDSVL